MKLKNLIFVSTLVGASLTSVLGANHVNHDYESLKSCIRGDMRSCPDLKQIYGDDAQFKESERTLHRCMTGKLAKNGRKSNLKALKTNLKGLKSIFKLP